MTTLLLVRTSRRGRRGSTLLPLAVAATMGALVFVHVRNTRTALAREATFEPRGTAIEVELVAVGAASLLSEPRVELSMPSGEHSTILALGERLVLREHEWRRAEPRPVVPGWRLRPGRLVPARDAAGRPAPVAALAIEAVPLHRVHVRAVDAESGAPIAEYRVRLVWRAEGATDDASSPSFEVREADGVALFDGVPLARGALRAEVEAEGYAPDRGAWQRLDEDGWIELEARLASR